MLLTKKSNPNKPARVMIYGVEGVGKSTLGAKADNPVFISPEGGTDQLRTKSGDSVDEIPGVDSWDSLVSSLKSVLTQEHDFKTLVLDSADWIESLCHAKIIGNSGKSITTANGGYGAGYRQAQSMHKELIDLISQIREKRNMHIIVTAHAHVKAVKDPSMLDDYDSYEIKCHEMVSSLWREWVDALFFVRFNTFVKSSDDTVRARALTDGTRVLYTVKQPSFQAKNRYGMPPEMTFTEGFWDEFVTYLKKGPKPETTNLSADDVEKTIGKMIDKLQDKTTKDLAIKTLSDALGDINKLLPIQKRLEQLTKGV